MGIGHITLLNLSSELHMHHILIFKYNMYIAKCIVNIIDQS